MDWMEDLQSGTACGPEHVLVVEDNLIIAMDLQSEILALGARSVDIATGVAQALEAIGRKTPHFAFLDVRLGEELSFPVADALHRLDISFAFATGFGEEAEIPRKYGQVPFLLKPFEVRQLRSLLFPQI